MVCLEVAHQARLSHSFVAHCSVLKDYFHLIDRLNFYTASPSDFLICHLIIHMGSIFFKYTISLRMGGCHQCSIKQPLWLEYKVGLQKESEVVIHKCLEQVPQHYMRITLSASMLCWSLV